MSNLRLINETTIPNGTSSSITNNLFNADFDIYNLQIKRTLASATGGMSLRLVNSSGSIIPILFDLAYLGMNSHTTFHEGRVQNNSFFQYLDWASGTVADQSSINLYVFNPFSSSSYTFFMNQTMSTYAPAGLATNGFKGIAVAKNTSSATGIQLQPSQGGTFGLEIRTYGLRVDS